MKTALKIKQFLSLNKEFFIKIKKYPTLSGSNKAKRFWLYAESLGEFGLALYVINIIKSILSENKELEPVFFMSFKTGSTLSLARKYNGILYFFHPPWGFKLFFKRYISAVKPDYFISIQHPVSKNFIKELLKINTKLIFSGITAADLKKMNIDYRESYKNKIANAEPEPGEPPFLSATVSGNPGAMSVKFNASPLSLKFISCADDYIVKEKNAGLHLKENSAASVIVISFVSIHKKESGFILNLIKDLIADISLKDTGINIKFIFVPRNIKNSSALFRASSEIGLNSAYYNENTTDFLARDGINSLIIDKYGIVGDIYSISDIVYVGKSLFEKEKGGHNILEPASFGKSIVTGAYSTNFSDIVKEMLKFNAITEVTEYNFKSILINLIINKSLRDEIGRNGLNYCIKKRDEFNLYFRNYLAENII